MSEDTLGRELERFLQQFPDTRFMDVIAPDMNGIPRGKRIEADDFAKVFGHGTNFCAASTTMTVMGDACEDVTYGAHDGDPDVKSVAVAGSLAPVPWAAMPTAQCLAELCEFDGTPFFLDPRNVLRGVVDRLLEADLHPVMATELEFYLVEQDGSGFKPRMPRLPGMDIAQTGTQFASFDDLDDVEPFLTDLDAFCRVQNIPAGAALSEYSPGQYEVNLTHVDNPLLACDHAVLLKRAVKAAARKNGLMATFMAKPFKDYAGNGLHLHISMLDSQGANIFAGQSADGDFSDTLRHAVGGMAAAMPESMAVFAPNANSYRRYAPGFYVPASPNWGPNHRNLSMRIPVSGQKNRRVEHRVAGADANPYLVVAAVLAAMHHGITRQLEPEPMTPEKTEIEYTVTLPVRWPLALDAYQAGTILPDYLGQEYHRVYGVCRSEEATLFHAEVTDRDYAWYLRAV